MAQERKPKTRQDHGKEAAYGAFIRARVEQDLYDRFRERARAEERDVSSQIRFLMRRYVSDDDAKTAA